MIIKGIVQIQRLDATTLEVLETIEKENTITLRGRTLATRDVSAFTFGPNIILGTENAPSAADFCWIKSYVVGATPTGATSPQLITNTSPIYSQWIQRFTPPSTGTRNIYLIGLTDLASNGATEAGMPVNAYVYLSTPCTQSSTELLDVTYRIQWIPDVQLTSGQSLSPTDIYTTAYYLTFTGQPNIRPQNLFANALPVKSNPTAGQYGNLYQDYYGSGLTSVPYQSGTGITNTKYATAVDTNSSSTPMPSPSKGVMNVAFGTDAAVGTLFGSEMYSPSSFRLMSWKNITAPTGSPVQPIHSHAAATFSTSSTPFLDANAATGTGKLAGGGTWTNPDFPEHYMVKITGTGAVGTATYQFWKRNMFGYIGTSFQPRSAGYLQLGCQVDLASATPFANVPVPNTHGFYAMPVPYPYAVGTSRVRVCKLDKKHIVTADNTGITIFNAADASFVNLDSTTTPALPVTSVNQVSANTNTGDIWVACAATGLWKVSNLGTVVTHVTVASNGVPSDTCYGVDVGVSGKIWAIFNGGVSVSSDGGTSWTSYNPSTIPAFTFTGITDNNWNTVRYMKCDPSHADDRMAFVRDPDTAVLQTTGIVWWSLAVPTASSVTVSSQYSQHRAHTQGIDVSDNGSFWVMGGSYGAGTPPQRLTYGSGTISGLGAVSTPNFCPIFWFINSSVGQPLVVFPTSNAAGSYTLAVYDSLGTLVVNPTLYNPGGTGDYNIFSSQQAKSYVVYLGDGVVFAHGCKSGAGVTQVAHVIATATDTSNTFVGGLNHVVWSKYGWDGSAWVLNGLGSKTTHSTDDLLLNGLTLRFIDGASGTSFVQGEYYTFGVANGILKDNSIAYTSTTSTHLYPTHTSADFSGVVRPYPSTGTVTWKIVSSGFTVNPDQSLVNANTNRPYGLYAISNNRVFGDFTITGTLTNGNASKVQIGLTPMKGPMLLETSYWTESYYNPVGVAEHYINYDSGNVYWGGFTSNSSFPTPAGTTTWSLSRVGTTLTLTIGGVVRSTVTTSTHSYVIRVLTAYNSTGTTTIPAMTVTTSGTGYYTSCGLLANNTGVYDPNFLFVEPDTSFMQLALNGTPVTVKQSNVASAPAPGEVVLLAAHGDLLFNAADAGKTVTGSYIYATK